MPSDSVERVIVEDINTPGRTTRVNAGI